MNLVYFLMFIGMLPLKKDIDAVIDELPHVLTGIISVIKFYTVCRNRHRIKTLLDLISKDWEVLTNELHLLNKITAKGSKVAHLYRTILSSFAIIFVSVPLSPLILDMILPLNETRPRQPMFRATYVFANADDHFYFAYVHMTSTASLGVLLIISVDSLYMLIIHHASGLFDVCGYQVEMATNSSELMYGQFKQCVVTHHKALHFFDTVQECSQNMNLALVGINMMLISLTAVQILLYADRPADAMRFVLFLIGEKFHLFVISSFGQILLNYASTLPEKIFGSNWYEMPVKYQKLLYMMIIRGNKICNLSAGGIYDMNIENFGKTIKACMSYFTMFLSLRE